MLKYAAEAFRRKKYEPINGIRNWDFLELDPGFRFGIVDYDRVPKLGYYFMKRAQAPAAIAQVGIRRLQREYAGKGVAEGQVAHLSRGAARGIKSSDQRAHTGAGEPVDGDVVLLKPFEHADVGQTQRAPTLQGHADGRPA